ncbi:MAG TPA: ABC transporter ATP-binding protein [Acidimicrobiia bacterium]|nr:ABC transporter ATP-binding protein [Acidimicrobiia bacterium]
MTPRDAHEPLIEVRDLTVAYPLGGDGSYVVALDSIDFDVREGEFVTILGPSGCGKTTLLNVIAGLVKPTLGAVKMRGEAITKPGPDRAVVFQEHALFPWRTVWNNIRYGIEMQGSDRQAERDARIAEVVKLVGLEGFEKAYPRELSGGMQQRVGLARAIVADPRMLLMDEPFGAIDALTREVMRNEIERIILETGKTVVFITHSIDEAILLGDRVVVFSPRPGTIKFEATIDLPRPRYEYDPRAESAFIELREELWDLLVGTSQESSEPDGNDDARAVTTGK